MNNINKKKTSSNKEEKNCPPYLIIHDGEYSTIAFLSPEVCAEYNNSNGNGNNIPPNKSLISITHYTVSTIYQCCTTTSSSTATTTTTNSNNNNNTTHLQIIKNLSTNPRTIPKPYSQQIQNQIQNPKLYTCLYIQSSIIVIGAENQGLINNPIDVHCSVLLRRCLIAHEMQNGRGSSDREVGQGGGGGNANEEDLEEKEEKEEHSHNVLITRLEAVHLHYQDLAEKKFHDEQHELNQLHHHPVQQQQEQQQQQQGRGGGLLARDSPSSPTTSPI